MVTSIICYGAVKTPYKYEYTPALRRLAIRLLIARAAGLQINTGYVLARHEDWPKELKVVRERKVVLSDSVTQDEAKQRLATLCEMARVALVSPCGKFGKTATADSDKMLSEFNFFVESDEFHKSGERVVFGDDPMFSEIFHAKSPVLNFWGLHQKVFTIDDNYRRPFIVS